MIVDDCLGDPDAVIAIAARHDYGPIGPFYPGIRAAVSRSVAMPLVAPLLGEIQLVFGLDTPPAYFECYLSLVTTAPAGLRPIQRLPHFDGVERDRIAVLLYLDRAERGGTAFYRQRSTGFECIDADRFDAYRTNLAHEIERFGLPEQRYIADDTGMFEKVFEVASRFNRMIVYRGNTLHCAALAQDFVPDPDPVTGRLTLNLFLAASGT
jgi:hypothetical protein